MPLEVLAADKSGRHSDLAGGLGRRLQGGEEAKNGEGRRFVSGRVDSRCRQQSLAIGIKPHHDLCSPINLNAVMEMWLQQPDKTLLLRCKFCEKSATKPSESAPVITPHNTQLRRRGSYATDVRNSACEPNLWNLHDRRILQLRVASTIPRRRKIASELMADDGESVRSSLFDEPDSAAWTRQTWRQRGLYVRHVA